MHLAPLHHPSALPAHQKTNDENDDQRLQQSSSTPRFVPDLSTISEGQPSFFGSCPRVSYHSESYITKYVEYATLIFPKGLSRQSVSHGGAHRTLNGNQERRSLSARAFPGCMN